MARALNWLTNLFPVWAVVCGGIALVHPPAFTWFKGEAIVWGLAVIMLGMGVTLSVEDFKNVLKIPRTIAAGFVAQYLIMPFLGFMLAHAFRLETHLAVGLILVACCPGGTASNVVTYLARANVALSVLMTMCSTFGAIVMTPLLTQWLAGTLVPVPAWGLFESTVKVVLLPLLLGLGLHHAAPRLVQRVLPACPLVSVVTIVLIVASILGQNAAEIKRAGVVLLLAVFLLHALGFLLGYFFGRWLGYEETINRTISIEVGMQNSGLGVVLAQRHFPGTTASVPCAISSVFHSVIGSLLAGWWRWRPAGAPHSQASSPQGPR